MKKSRLIFGFLLLLPLPGRANLVTLVRELISHNAAIYSSKAKIEKSQNEIEAFYAKMPWSFFYRGSITQNKRDYLIEYLNYNAEYYYNELGIEKEFIFGGKFNYRILSSNQFRYENNAAVQAGEPAQVYELLQNFNYTQDIGKNFFGRELFKEVEIREKDKLNSESSYDLELETKILEFFKTYIDVRLLKSIVVIENNALNRSKERVKAISKMVKDGLRLKVDLLEAKYDQIEYEENKKRVLVSLGTALENLSNLLHREVKEFELEPLPPFEKIFPFTLKSRGEILGNKNIKNLAAQAEVLQANLEKINYGFFPTLNIEADYLSNAIEPTRSLALSKAFFSSGYEVKGIINLKWPLGYPEKETDRIRTRIDLNILQVEKSSTLNNLKNSEKYIFFRLKNLEDALEMGKRRWELSKEIVRDYNRLYGLGRTRILESLTAEENRIFTEKSYIINFAEREKLYASLAYLWGRLKDTILTLK